MSPSPGPTEPVALRLNPDTDLRPARAVLLDRLSAAGGTLLPLAEVATDARRRLHEAGAPGTAVTDGWRVDARDQVDLRWWPQGVVGLPEAPHLMLMSWYAKKLPWDREKHGARLSVLDLRARRYRHVLLVRPRAAQDGGGFEPLAVHAGGLAVAGRHLHVAATGGGLWTADLADVVRLAARDTASRRAALGYRYLLPVQRRFRTPADTPGGRFRFSFVTTRGSALLAAEYTNSPTATKRIARFPIDDAGLPTAAPATLIGDGVLRMQGIEPSPDPDDGYMLSVSQGRTTRGSLVRGRPGHWREERHALPMGCEDLTRHDGALWTVSEHPGVRWLARLAV